MGDAEYLSSNGEGEGIEAAQGRGDQSYGLNKVSLAVS